MIRSHSRATRFTALLTLTILSLTPLAPVFAAQPTVKQAFGLVPMQREIELAPPNEKRIDEYKVEAENSNGKRAWIVRDPDGILMRRFSDTNGDNKIDQWCYFRNGVEVYRDIDSDFNEKADQYRWFGTGGLR